MPQPGGPSASNQFLPYPNATGASGGNFPPYPTGGGNFMPYPPTGGQSGSSAGYPPYMNYPQPGGYPGGVGYVRPMIYYKAIHS